MTSNRHKPSKLSIFNVNRIPTHKTPTEVTLKWASQTSQKTAQVAYIISINNLTNHTKWCFISTDTSFSLPGQILHTDHAYRVKVKANSVGHLKQSQNGVRHVVYQIISHGKTSFTMGESHYNEPPKASVTPLTPHCNRPTPKSATVTWEAPPKRNSDNTWATVILRDTTSDQDHCFWISGVCNKFLVPKELLLPSHGYVAKVKMYDLRPLKKKGTGSSPLGITGYCLCAKGDVQIVTGKADHKKSTGPAISPLKVYYVQHTSISAVINWETPAERSADITCALVTVTDATSGQQWCYNNPDACGLLPLCPGHDYIVVVRLYGIPPLMTQGAPDQSHPSAQGQVTFRAELTFAELQELLNRARMFKGNVRKFLRCRVFYRNKPVNYFMDIYSKHKGVMKVYLKDDNGDPGSPINSKLNGLFFGVSVDHETGEPPELSHFGPRRLSIPSSYMFDRAPNLYFADFYCNRQAHYVTLVMTSSGSKADAFCAEKLLRLDVHDNGFLNLDAYTGNATVTSKLWVEVLYTNNVDLNDVIQHRGAQFSNTESTGTSRPGGIPKNPTCRTCNLY